MPSSDVIKVKGLKELQSALKRADGQSQKKLRLVLNEAATDVVKGALPFVPRMTGAAAASLKAQSSQREARVKGGSAKAPYYPWLDFGGSVGRNNSISRPFIKDGRYIYPTAKKMRPEISRNLDRALAALVKSLD